MSDIGKLIRDRETASRDPEGRLLEMEPWSEAEALRRAAGEGIETLLPEHWDVVNFLRQRYLEEGQAGSGREVLYRLEERYAAQGGRRFLYRLFPHGPVTQGSRIAGVPLPPYTVDKSFGSVE